MTLDVSLEAIEADLAIAERGGQVATLAMARAQVRATLLAAQPADHQGRHEALAPTTAVAGDIAHSPDIVVAKGPDVDVYTVPKAATWDDRVTAAAILLSLDGDSLRYALQLITEARDGVPDAPTEEEARAGEPEEDIDADFFAEAKKARKRK